MLLQTGNPSVRFAPRPIEGVTLPFSVEPERLILDGQQRLTSLFQALFLKVPVKTRDIRGQDVERRYYIDINRILDSNGDRDEAIISVPADGILRGRNGVYAGDYSSTQKECEGEVLPVNILFDPQALLQWQTVYFADHSQITARSMKWSKLMSEVFPRF